jgi:cytochrome c-type biogenesis protein CcmH
VAERLVCAWALAVLLAPAPWAFAKEAAPAAQDPILEQRVMAIAAELRCLVCQNQTIADSNAELAADLRNQVREKVRDGQSDREIIDFMVARYGDFVLYRPPFKATTMLLWLGPLLLLATGLAILFRRLARPRVKGDAEITADERERARRLLAGNESGEG